MSTVPATSPTRDLPTLLSLEDALRLPGFKSDTAWQLGCRLRVALQQSFPKASALVNISLTNSQVLFQCAVGPGTAPDNEIWVARKRKTVLRWGHSTWWMHNKMGGDEVAFAKKFALGERAGEYAIHGGGFPIRVVGVEAPVGVIVVSGLKQEEDHQIIVATLEQFLNSGDQEH